MVIEKNRSKPPWILLVFTLPTKRASQRVEVWRKLQRYGSVPLGNSGYLLPNDEANQERFEWLATAIRKYGGDASVVQVQAIDNLSTPQLIDRFAEARARDYQEVIQELQRLSSLPLQAQSPARLSRLRGRFQEIVGIDFFNSALQKRVEELLDRADAARSPSPAKEAAKVSRREYVRRIWVTRPRPGVDRSASAWLIRRYIDPKARFTFAPEGRVPREAVPFDMFHGGFGHQGEDCTFETLQKAFRIRNHRVAVIGQIIHDADLLDEEFGRKEGFGIDEVLKGWARQGVADSELLARGMQLIDGLYHSLP